MDPSQTRSPPHLTTLVMMTGLAVMSLNMFVPSLFNIATSFSASYALTAVSIAGYLGITALFQLVLGPISDRFGRRPVVLVGLIIFVLASVGCALSTDITTFLTFRMLQASIATSTAMAPAIVRDTVPPSEAASRIGYLAMAMAVSPLLGPVLGGVLDDTFGWQSNFFFMAGCGVLVLVLCWFDLGETNDKPSSTFAAQFKTYPTLLGSGQFWAYAFCTAFSIGAFFTFISGAPVVAQTVLNLSTKTLGILIGSITLGYMVGSFLSGRYSTRAGLTRMILSGRVITFVGLLAGFIAVMSGHITVLTVFGATMFVGLGNGLSIPSSNVGSLSVQPRLAGSAAGLSAALTVGIGAVLTSIAGLMVQGPDAASILLGMMLLTSVIALVAALMTREAPQPAAVIKSRCALSPRLHVCSVQTA